VPNIYTTQAILTLYQLLFNISAYLLVLING